MKLEISDIIETKKEHPCGEKKFIILRKGADFKIECIKCKRQIWMSREKLQKRVKRIIKDEFK